MGNILLSLAVVVICVLGLLFPNNRRVRGWVPEGQRWSILGPALVFGGAILWYVVYTMIYGAQ